MAYPVKQSSTTRPLIFLMIDSTDGKSGKTGLTPTVTISKNGGSFISPSGAVTEIGSGLYKVAPNATDNNTLGPLTLHATATGADPCDYIYPVVAFDPDDPIRMGLTALPNVAQGNVGALPTGDASGRIDLGKWLGTAPLALSSQQVQALVSAYGTGLDPATQVLSTPANKLVTDTSGRVTVGSVTATVLTAIRTEMEGATYFLDTLINRLTSTRAGYLDKLNISGIVASQADIVALNQSASRRIMVAVVPSMERPESGNNTYTIEARLWTADGVAVNGDADPTIAAVGKVSGSLNANLSAITNPLTGVYRWTYTVGSAATLEEVRFDVSALVSTEALQMSALAQVADFVAATFTAADRTAILAAQVAAEAAQARVVTGIPNATPGTTFGLPLKSDLPVAPDNTTIGTINTTLNTLVGKFAGITLVANWFRLLSRKSVGDATALTELNTGGGTYDPTTDSTEAIRDRGDGAWTTGGGGTAPTVVEIAAEIERTGGLLDKITKTEVG